jgi:polyhydroxyalkanoate synthesis regulator phasin
LPPVPEPPVEVPTGTTTTIVEEPTPETTLPEETTTTTEPEPETTEPETTTIETYPDTTVEETTTTTVEPNLEPNLEPLTEEEITAVVEELTTIEELTPEVLSEVVGALNSDNISEEQVQAIVDAVVENLDTLTEVTPEVLDEVISILESDSVTEKQVQDIVDTILDTDITTDQATQLATSAAVLENITGNQASEVFASIDTGELSGEEAAAIVDALLEAPTEVKEAFEEEINVFEGGFDEYVPTDSAISVGARRVVVAATTVSFILPAPVVSRRQSIL